MDMSLDRGGKEIQPCCGLVVLWGSCLRDDDWAGMSTFFYGIMLCFHHLFIVTVQWR